MSIKEIEYPDNFEIMSRAYFEREVKANSLLYALGNLIDVSIVDRDKVDENFERKNFATKWVTQKDIELQVITDTLIDEINHEIFETLRICRHDNSLPIFDLSRWLPTGNMSLYEARVYELFSHLECLFEQEKKAILFFLCSNKAYNKFLVNRFSKRINNFRAELYGKQLVRYNGFNPNEKRNEAMFMAVGCSSDKFIKPLKLELTLPTTIDQINNATRFEYFVKFTRLIDVKISNITLKVD